MAIISKVLQNGLYVFFNILHLLTVGTFIYWLFEKYEAYKAKKESIAQKDILIIQVRQNVYILLFSLILLFSAELLPLFDRKVDTYLLLPLGILPRDYIQMGDYLPLIPWLGVFLIGVVIGRIAYREKRTLFPDASKIFLKMTVPFEWIGRNSLVVYIIHQPIMLAILFGGRYLGWW
jgi:hypothetical protein